MQLNWGILGTGSIARKFAEGVLGSRTGKLVAVGSRSQESADTFADKFSISTRHATYEALLADPNVQAIYIATPHPMHMEWAIRIADAGKHVLCEKPITLNASDTAKVVDAAQRNNVVLMEAFMYRCHPQTAKLVELLRQNVIGQVRMISATFAFSAGFNAESRLFKRELGGGGILDVGCYATSMARLIAGVAQGGEFAEPTEVVAVGHLNEAGTDSWTAAVLKFPGDIVAQVATGVQWNGSNNVVIHGEKGSIEIPSPWFCDAGEGNANIKVFGENAQEIEARDERGLYAIEADTFAEAVETGKVPHPAMSPQDSLGNMQTLDKWRAAIGLRYPQES
ncbi:MAG TPA: Gfo/Idh/MocA family oxidoreductase [Abditibacteriaceae bacterium]|jgi:predicted dehydrogenase